MSYGQAENRATGSNLAPQKSVTEFLFSGLTMHSLNHTLECSIIEADGRYLSAQDLYPLEQYVQTYAARVATYQQLSQQSEKLVLQSLRKLALSHPDLIRQHGSRCKYDMTEVFRYIALSILRDDEIFFKEQMMSWLDTILVAYKQNNHCAMAYHYLQEIVEASLPPASSGLIRPYLDHVIQSLKSHA